MRTVLSAGAALLVGLLLVGWAVAAAEDKKDRPVAEEPPPSPAAEDDFRQTKEWKALNRLVGAWDQEVTVILPEARRALDSLEAAWILGDRFLQMKGKSNLDNSEYVLLLGYDRNRQTLRLWFYNSHGFAFVASGGWDEATRTFTWKGEDMGPMTFLSTDRFLDDDHREWKNILKGAEGKVVYEASGKSTRRKTTPGRAGTDVPPKTAADTANRFITLLKAGNVTAAARHLPPLDTAEALKGLERAAEALQKGQTMVELVESREEGDLAGIVWKVVEKEHGETDPTYQPGAMVRQDGIWRMCPVHRTKEIRPDGTEGPSRETMQIDAGAAKLSPENQKKMEALWKWAQERCRELGKDSEKVPARDKKQTAPKAERAKPAAARIQINLLRMALDAFELDMGRYPTTQENLSALLNPPPGAKDWKGPYLEGAVKDPWGRPYVYRCPGTHNPNGFDLCSFGPDGKEGDDDIDNWSK